MLDAQSTPSWGPRITLLTNQSMRLLLGDAERAHTRVRVCGPTCRCNETAISLRAGCELFLRYTTRVSNLESEDFETAKQRIIEVIPTIARPLVNPPA